MSLYQALNHQGRKSLISHAFADRFGVPLKTIRRVGTARLCLCRSDEARLILIKACRGDRWREKPGVTSAALGNSLEQKASAA